MTALHEYLQQSAARDADGTWDWLQNPKISLLTGKSDLAKWLKENPPTGRLKLVPVSSWYMTDEMRQWAKNIAGMDKFDPTKFVYEASEKLGVEPNTHIKKLLPTNATKGGKGLNKISWIVSPEMGDQAIRKGDEFILVDDIIMSGGTLRDMIKHINLRGGIVKAVINTELGIDFASDHAFSGERSRMRESEKLAALLYAVDHKLTGKIEKICKGYGEKPFDILGILDEQKSVIMSAAKQKADQYLEPMGLRWNQLTSQEFDKMCSDIERRGELPSSDVFWQYQTERMEPYLPAPVEKVERLQELSDMLGTEFKAKWTKDDRDADNTQEIGNRR